MYNAWLLELLYLPEPTKTRSVANNCVNLEYNLAYDLCNDFNLPVEWELQKKEWKDAS